MAVSNSIAVSDISETESTPPPRPLEDSDDVVVGVVNYKGCPANRVHSGRWKSAVFIIGGEVAERIAYYGIGYNLISYLTGPLGQSTATAAANVNAWFGAGALLPLFGAFTADSFLGPYSTILFSSLLYILGLCLLTSSAVLLPVVSPSSKSQNSPSQLQLVFFFSSLYLVAIAEGGHKPCILAFGANQFDEQDPEECKARSSFFNWFFFCLCAGPSLALPTLTYVQDNLGWGIGFGIPCIFMAVSLFLFLIGTKTYRYNHLKGSKSRSLFAVIGKIRPPNWKSSSSTEVAQGALPGLGSHQSMFLNGALLEQNSMEKGVEEAKVLLRLFPIWTTCLVYAVVSSQAPTLFTEQGTTLDRSLGRSFNIPAASLQYFIGLSVALFIPIYDRIFVPIARTSTGKPSGITMLQRIGTGIFLSVVAMIVAALVERKRLEIAQRHWQKTLDIPNAGSGGGVVPMRFWWLVPQYTLFGVANVFTMVGLQELFYDQVPNEMKSVGSSLHLSIFGIGHFLSGFLIFVIEKTTGGGVDGWFSNDPRRAHLDYFYWVLAGLSAVELVAYFYFAKSYVCKTC